MTVKEMFQKAIDLRDQKNYSEALKILQDIEDQCLNSPNFFAVSASICWELKQLDNSIKNFKEAIKLAPQSELVSLGLFHCLWELKRFDEAFEEMKRFSTISFSQEYKNIIEEISSLSDSENEFPQIS